MIILIFTTERYLLSFLFYRLGKCSAKTDWRLSPPDCRPSRHHHRRRAGDGALTFRWGLHSHRTWVWAALAAISGKEESVRGGTGTRHMWLRAGRASSSLYTEPCVFKGDEYVKLAVSSDGGPMSGSPIVFSVIKEAF